MTSIVWSPEAIEDLNSLRSYIAADDPAAARRIALHILDVIETLLAPNPQMGRAGRVPGTRELVISGTPFVVPYRLHGATMHILRVYHGAQKWPQRL